MHAAVLALALLVSCARPANTKTSPSSGTSTPGSPAQTTIRFGLIGEVTAANVWSLFDKQGYSYNNYAIRSGYWPRLYGLSIPDNHFEAEAAGDVPTAIRQEGAFYTATVPLRTDLAWTDGTPFTADDVAFTVNAALEFQLGFDWKAYYDPQWLDHAEAVEPHVVKFYFRQMPGVGVWQYGALQGPVVQHEYWASRIAAPAALLPSTELTQQIKDLQDKIAGLQEQVNALNLSTYTTLGEEARQTQAGLKRQQGDLDQAINDLTKAQADRDSALNAARAALYALKDSGEPYLGSWLPASIQDGSGTVLSFENDASAKFPGAAPQFQHAAYYAYATREAALSALEQGTVDVILDPSAPSAGEPAQHAMTSPTRSERFLAFNLTSGSVSDPPLRKALACMIDQAAIVSQLAGRAHQLESFVPPEESDWYNADAPLPCSGLDTAGRLTQAIATLKAAGYSWAQEPSAEIAGQGLMTPNGKPLTDIQLLSPSSDDMRGTAATYVEQQALLLGIPLRIESVNADAIDYAVFSSRRYDAAVVGWRVSSYPGYLCDWFGLGGPFHYDPSQLTSACGGLAASTDLEGARQQIKQLQTILAAEVPMIPLYAGLVYEPYRNIAYAFDHVLDGLGGVYGAAALAMPVSR